VRTRVDEMTGGTSPDRRAERRRRLANGAGIQGVPASERVEGSGERSSPVDL
jgi:hypothetical protein